MIFITISVILILSKRKKLHVALTKKKISFMLADINNFNIKSL